MNVHTHIRIFQARKTTTSIAKSASVWTQTIKSAPESVDRLTGKTMASATTTTITAAVAGIKETAAAFPAKRISLSSAKIARLFKYIYIDI